MKQIVKVVSVALLLGACASQQDPFAEPWYFAGKADSSEQEFVSAQHMCWERAQHAYFTAPRGYIPPATAATVPQGYYNSPSYGQAGGNLTAAIINLSTPATTGMTVDQGVQLYQTCMQGAGFERIAHSAAIDRAYYQKPTYVATWGAMR